MTATAGRRRDWFCILRDLMRAGVSMRYVARKCDRDACTVQAWAEGGEPKDSDARVVLTLYAKHCPIQFEAHQREFGIGAQIENVTSHGESRALPFVG